MFHPRVAYWMFMTKGFTAHCARRSRWLALHRRGDNARPHRLVDVPVSGPGEDGRPARRLVD